MSKNPKLLMKLPSTNEQDSQEKEVSPSLKVDPAAYRKIQPLDFLAKFLEKNVRPDGRKLEAKRSFLYTANSLTTSRGSGLVRLGNTSVICGIKAEVSIPHEQEPNKGFCFCNVEIPKIASSSLSSFNQSSTSSSALFKERDDLGMKLTSSISKILNQCVDRTKLSIVEEKSAWVLYLDVYVLENDGNLFDACLLSCLIALKNLQLFKVEHDEEKDEVSVVIENDKEVREPVPGLLKYLPIPLTFALISTTTSTQNIMKQADDLPQSTFVLVDPTKEEEELASSSFTIIYNAKSLRLNQVLVHPKGSNLGGSTYQSTQVISDTLLQKSILYAKNKIPEVLEKLNK